MSHHRKDLFPVLQTAPGGSLWAAWRADGSALQISSKERPGLTDLSGDRVTLADLGGLKVTHCKPNTQEQDCLDGSTVGNAATAPSVQHNPQDCCPWTIFRERPIRSPFHLSKARAQMFVVSVMGFSLLELKHESLACCCADSFFL